MPTVRQRYRRTDGRTDRRTDGRPTIAILRFALRASRGKNHLTNLIYITNNFLFCLPVSYVLNSKNHILHFIFKPILCSLSSAKGQ